MTRRFRPPFAPDAVFSLTPATVETPLVFAAPHAGDAYPDDLGADARLSPRSLRSAEDRLTDRLAHEGTRHGVPLIAGRIGRAYVDLNRAPDDLDPALLDDAPTGPPSPRALAGYGVIPRLAGDGAPLYDRRISRVEAETRIKAAHAPYHAALAALMTSARSRCGRGVLVDWHSMPARPRGAPAGADVVLGDRHGSACRPRLTRRLRELFEAVGWRVALNVPYAGGWSTQTWGRPADGFDAIQVEISRGLYWDAEAETPSPGYEPCRRAVARVITALCAEDWRA